jgi:hypothetical protein
MRTKGTRGRALTGRLVIRTDVMVFDAPNGASHQGLVPVEVSDHDVAVFVSTATRAVFVAHVPGACVGVNPVTVESTTWHGWPPQLDGHVWQLPPELRYCEVVHWSHWLVAELKP